MLWLVQEEQTKPSYVLEIIIKFAGACFETVAMNKTTNKHTLFIFHTTELLVKCVSWWLVSLLQVKRSGMFIYAIIMSGERQTTLAVKTDLSAIFLKSELSICQLWCVNQFLSIYTKVQQAFSLEKLRWIKVIKSLYLIVAKKIAESKQVCCRHIGDFSQCHWLEPSDLVQL